MLDGNGAEALHEHLDRAEREMTYPDDIDLETPEADAAEQATAARLEDDDGAPGTITDDEAPEWDAQEQHRIVEIEDEYR